jgi:hypothetical protein
MRKKSPVKFTMLLLAGTVVLLFAAGCKELIDTYVQKTETVKDDNSDDGAGWENAAPDENGDEDGGDGDGDGDGDGEGGDGDGGDEGGGGDGGDGDGDGDGDGEGGDGDGGGEGGQSETVTDPAGGTWQARNGSGTLKSQGRAASGAATYYVDAENGRDSYNGTSPLSPWKSFKNVNAKTFQPGDHILLEADSVWNGESVTTANRATLLNSDKVGMLWPKGNGSEGNPIVIDLYDIDDFSKPTPTVSWSANKRPVINGNGTPSTDNTNYPYRYSGAVTLENQSYWEIYNIECTNTFDIGNPNHWYDMQVRKGLAGIIAYGTQTGSYKHIVIRNCYVHDVQSESTNNKTSPDYTSNYFGGSHNPSKVVGGIIVNATGYDGIWMEDNIVKKVGLEGLRTAASGNQNVSIRGNYIETIAGDGIVLAGTLASGPSFVEHNIVKDSCAAPNTNTGNYAAVWAYIVKTATFQYNEAYGTVYGYQDGEAWDIDSSCDKVIYQYNYSHHNAGGAILFMSGITDGVFRHNISANDGGGTRYMAAVTDGVSVSANSYTAFSGGQTLFHYAATGTSASNQIPLIYNNTFYIGDGITCGLFGHNSSSAENKYVRFYNNILLKAGTGTVYLSYGHSGSGNAGYIHNDAGFKNNIIWGYDTEPDTGNQAKFSNGGGTAAGTLFTSNNNKWQNPGLKIQQDSHITQLRNQRDDAFPAGDYNDPEKLKTFTGVERLRSRASLFSPADASKVTGGMEIPAGGGSAVDNAWNGDQIKEDIFGVSFTPSQPPIGAAVRPYP